MDNIFDVFSADPPGCEFRKTHLQLAIEQTNDQKNKKEEKKKIIIKKKERSFISTVRTI